MATSIHNCPISYDRIKRCLQTNYTQKSASDELWQSIKQEAESDMEEEPILRNYYFDLILSHACLESSLSYILATKLHIPAALPLQTLYNLFLPIIIKDPIKSSLRADLKAIAARDPACTKTVHCLLHYKGFLAVQAHRAAHWLYCNGRRSTAYLIQSRVSEMFNVDVHPGARIGKGMVMDHGNGVVIGETAMVGDGVTIMHNVTLGGNGKEVGDRHPKIGDGVMIGAATQVLGGIKIGHGAKVGAGSVVLKDVAAGCTVVGNPAKVVVRVAPMIASDTLWSDYVI